MSRIRIFIFLLVIAAAPVHAEDDIERGAILADTCMGCHGIPGYRNGYPAYRVPMLGGQHKDYLVIALQGYQSEGRHHPTMRAQAATMSTQDMKDIAAFLASQGEAVAAPVKTSGAAIKRGQEKAAVCIACHGEAGVSSTGNWPTLAGQHLDYLVESLMQYKRGERKDPVMAGQVINLSEQDIEDISAFYAAQRGLFTADYAN